jgi:hypothetical protein
MQTWIASVWMPNNRIWIRNWSSGRSEELRFEDEFSTAPQVIETGCRKVVLRFEGSSTAKFWKDWIVSRIIPDLRDKFPEVGEFCKARNCKEDDRTISE